MSVASKRQPNPRVPSDDEQLRVPRQWLIRRQIQLFILGALAQTPDVRSTIYAQNSEHARQVTLFIFMAPPIMMLFRKRLGVPIMQGLQHGVRGQTSKRLDHPGVCPRGHAPIQLRHDVPEFGQPARIALVVPLMDVWEQ